MISNAWWESTDKVPIPRSIVQDELEVGFPDTQFSVIVEKPNGVVIYEIQWSGPPTNEKVLNILNTRLGSFGEVVVQLKRASAAKFGVSK